jgi:hypothetical protein
MTNVRCKWEYANILGKRSTFIYGHPHHDVLRPAAARSGTTTTTTLMKKTVGTEIPFYGLTHDAVY